MNTLAVH